MQRPLPGPGRGRLTPWIWELRRPGELTASRLQLHEQALKAGVPPDWIDEGVERLLLAYEELASNGLRHGRSPVQAAVTAAVSGWLIDVSDAAANTAPTLAVGRDPALGGLGLHLVARLSATHGWWIEAGRKHVWAYVALAPST